MHRSGLIRTFLAITVVLAMPSTVAAQEGAIEPEGHEWHLVSYESNGETVAVPLIVEATLLLEDGDASGSSGCNSFAGGYTIDGETLTFDTPLAVTQRACPGEASIEQGYLDDMLKVARWEISGQQLRLADSDGSVIFTYEPALSSLTQSDLAALAARFDAQQDQIDVLEERLENVRIGTLRDRIRSLEGQVATLQRQLRAQGPRSSSGSPARFNAAERILLEGVPGAIRSTCTPRRSENPRGTIAAVQCKPDTTIVRDMAYYLMPGNAATRVFQQRMDENGVRSGNRRCRDGVASLAADTPGPGSLGCYVNADGRANVRLVTPASGCNQLPVGDRTIRIPAIYVAVLGDDDDIGRLARWREARPGRPALTQEIERPNAPISPRCPS